MSYLAPVAWLTALWMVLWRSTTVATVATGVVLAVALTWGVRRSDAHRIRHRMRPLAMLRFAGHVLVALVHANLRLAWEILTPTDYTRPGILEVRLPPSSELELTCLAGAITLTPGTIVLDVDTAVPMLRIHVLHLRDVEAARAEVEHLHRLLAVALAPAEPVPDHGADRP